MSISPEDLQRGTLAQLEVLQMIRALHDRDRETLDLLMAVSTSTPADLLRGAVTIAELVLSLTGDFNYKLTQLRLAVARAGGDDAA